MIDHFSIFERGGTILWSKTYDTIKGDPLSVLVRTVLLEDRLAMNELNVDNYTLRWQLDNRRGVIFVVIFQKQLPPPYADRLLHLVRDHFVEKELADSVTIDTSIEYPHFSSVFETLLSKAEKQATTMNSSTISLSGKKIKQTKQKQLSSSLKNGVNATANGSHAQEVSKNSKKKNGKKSIQNSQTTDENDNSLMSEEELRRNREAFMKRGKARKKESDSSSSTANSLSSAPTTRKKIMRPNKSSHEDVSHLDFSEGKPPTAEELAEEEVKRFEDQFINAESNRAFDDILNDSEDDDDDDDDDDENEQESLSSSTANQNRGLFHYFKGLAGRRSLTGDDLKPVMDKFRDGLVEKNVAKDIADKLMESVFASLEGQTMESMTSVTTMVRKALDQALTRILTPRQSNDLISEISSKRGISSSSSSSTSKFNPYVITFCGVNGVGKSTSLAKTCFYLLNHGFKVLIAACDTFRAGAVEQLRTHVRCLGRGVQLFDRGYGKDAAAVAADAIRKAKELNYDVVLVDTAGRMQDNEPLMRALAKLVDVNQPDRIFFVGEALVGNDAVDQLTKFNQALIDYQPGANPRLIDGIVLTKFDTIDDKVGAAVSMVYTTGQPIVFIGIGQTYMDLRKLNSKALVKALLR